MSNEQNTDESRVELEPILFTAQPISRLADLVSNPSAIKYAFGRTTNLNRRPLTPQQQEFLVSLIQSKSPEDAMKLFIPLNPVDDNDQEQAYMLAVPTDKSTEARQVFRFDLTDIPPLENFKVEEEGESNE